MASLNEQTIVLYFKPHKPEIDESLLQQWWLIEAFLQNVEYQKHTPDRCFGKVSELNLKTAVIITQVETQSERETGSCTENKQMIARGERSVGMGEIGECD